ncbi:hypothetical protein BpHYR1_009373 [Brachionus plicatilis]|uniref:Uncharacterized protein n=1 Tax=Brachionus plicatilis TaxID=10195 RepID=A0A3M7Q903_BRAPC|nr:hypothetical protein BpHYR1_009373 [Brachionus plicatilis]
MTGVKIFAFEFCPFTYATSVFLLPRLKQFTKKETLVEQIPASRQGASDFKNTQFFIDFIIL